jgi:tetratricopeptide (TPR) repeat protein
MTDVRSPSIDPARVLDRAIDALNRHDPYLPLEDVDRALAQAPHDYRLWHIKGLIHREQEQRELAIPALRRAAEMAPTEPLVAHGHARTLLEAGLPSVEAFARALKLAPSNVELVKGLASALVADGRIADAIDGLATVVRRSPLWTDGHVLLSNLRWVNGERESFTRSFDEALREHPNSLELRREQMVLLLHAEMFDDVLARVEQGSSMFGPQPLFAINEASLGKAARGGAADRQVARQCGPGNVLALCGDSVAADRRCARRLARGR